MPSESSIARELAAAVPRPATHGRRADKKNYAERLSRVLAQRFANELRKDFQGILPGPDGRGQESRARSAKGFKKLDVNYSTPELGLGLGVSIKTINFADPRTHRYTKNFTRVDNELRAEAMDYHVRQPYAVLMAIVFLPADCCTDGSKSTPSSFGGAVQQFRARAGRRLPADQAERLEKIFIGLYELDGPVAFFDVEDPPPRRGRPPASRLLGFEELIAGIREVYDSRNNPRVEWDGD